MSTRKFHRCCSRCVSWQLNAQSRQLSHSAASIRGGTPVSMTKGQHNPHRRYTSAGPASQSKDVVPDPPASREELEQTVRQAKQAFRDTLPPGYLSQREYKVYERLYGAPLRKTGPEDVGLSMRRDNVARGAEDEVQAGVVREDGAAGAEEQLHDQQEGEQQYPDPAVEHEVPAAEDGSADVDWGALTKEKPTKAEDIEGIVYAKARNQRQYQALVQLQKDFEAARLSEAADTVKRAQEEEEDPDEDEVDDIEPEEEEEPGAIFARESRLHPFTEAAKFGTSPSTVFLPKAQFVEPITELLKRTSTTHLKGAAEKAFGGRNLPHSPATPDVGKNLPQKAVALQPTDHKLSEIEADVFIASVMPGVYASVKSVLTEVRKRLGPDWIKGLMATASGPRVLDAGAGGAGLMAWQDIFQAENEHDTAGQSFGEKRPLDKKTVIVASDEIRHRISRFLHNTTFLPRLPDYVHSADSAERQLDSPEVPQPRKVYDIIVATHLLMPLDKPHRRKEVLDNLWSLLNPDGGVLIVVEKGHPRGFEAVADVRMRLLDEFMQAPGSSPEISGPDDVFSKEPGMIIAPCTNHTKCPMYRMPGLTPGRKDFCHFSQRFIRPPFLQTIHEGRDRNHEDINFSYVAVQRGRHPKSIGDLPQQVSQPFLQGMPAADRAFKGYEAKNSAMNNPAPHPLALPRNVLAPLKSKGHVTLDLCTPAGTLERWVVPKSFSKQAYHDARKARWGDLWALGAKTRTVRHPRLGRALARARAEAEAAAREGDLEAEKSALKVIEDVENAPRDKGIRARRAAETLARGDKRKVVNIDLDDGPVKGKQTGQPPVGRRMKRGMPTPATRVRKEPEENEDEDEEQDEDDKDFKEIDRLLKEDEDLTKRTR